MANEVREVRFNEFFRGDNNQYQRFVEVICLLDKADYSLNNEGQIIRQRGLEKVSFVASESNLRKIGELFIKVAEDQKEKEVSNG